MAASCCASAKEARQIPASAPPAVAFERLEPRLLLSALIASADFTQPQVPLHNLALFVNYMQYRDQSHPEGPCWAMVSPGNSILQAEPVALGSYHVEIRLKHRSSPVGGEDPYSPVDLTLYNYLPLPGGGHSTQRLLSNWDPAGSAQWQDVSLLYTADELWFMPGAVRAALTMTLDATATDPYLIQSLEFRTVAGTAAPFEPNESQAAAVDLGAIDGYRQWRGGLKGCPQLSGASDEDWYRFELLDPGVTHTFAEVECFLDPAAAPQFELYDDGGSLLATGESTGPGLRRIPLHGRPAGTYYLRVSGGDAFHYALTVNAAGALETGPLTLTTQPGSDTGMSDQDGVTSIATPTIDIAGGQPGETVRVYRAGALLGEATDVGGGAFEYTFAAGALAEGNNTITARIFDGQTEGLDSAPLKIMLDRIGPQAIGFSPVLPVDLALGPVDEAYVTFNEEIDLTTVGAGFGPDDVTISGPGGAIAATGVASADNSEYRIAFAPQTVRGQYALTVGPQISDLAGNLMDQNGDGTGGEAQHDVFSFALTAVDPGSSVTFTTPTTIAADDPSHEGKDLIVRGTTVTIDGAHSFNSVYVVEGGVITHTAGAEDGLELEVAEGVLIDAASSISADGRGYAQGPGSGSGSSGRSGGGGYGGFGGNGIGSRPGGPIYGSAVAPAELGSGNVHGTPGGGAIRLVVGGTLTVAGSVTAAGIDGPGHYGGGSGGSIYLTVGSLAGGGVISADGGESLGPADGDTEGGGGGGGRIAICCNAKTFSGTISARGGAGLQVGGAGTIFTKVPGQEWGDLLIDNGGAIEAAATSLSEPERLDSLTINSGAMVELAGALTTDAFRLASGAELSHPAEQEGGLRLTVTGDAVIEADGRITADGLGRTVGPGTGSSSSSRGGGAGYGGRGGDGIGSRPGGLTYGSAIAPVELGSGDGYGTRGGGAIRLVVGGTLTVAGSVTAAGVDGSGHHGGGSGGSIYLTVGTLAGEGAIAADGGESLGFVGGDTEGGGGGGGRVAIHCDANTFSGAISARGGAGLQVGGAGTIFTKVPGQQWGDLLIDNGGATGAAATLLSDPETLDSLTINSGAMVDLAGALTTDAFRLASGAKLSHPAKQEGGLQLTVTGDAVIEAGGRVTADGLGHTGGPGRSNGSSNRSGGGGYGGSGGDGIGGRSGGPTYGSAMAPVELGSGDAYGTPGGGAIRLVVGGTLTVAGSVTAAGIDGADHHGGGSGGSIYLTVGALAGEGVIAAGGGNSPGPVGVETEGGGGGGGRVALYYHDRSAFSGSIIADGGTGFENGEAGSIYLGELQGPFVRSVDLGHGAGGADHLDVTFSEAVDPASFDGSDVVLTVPGGTEVAVTDPPALVAGNTWRLTFAPQPFAGEYRVAVGPHVADPDGHEMDQDLDLIEGEAEDDVYHATFLVSTGQIPPDAREPNDTRQAAADLGQVEGARSWPGLSIHAAGNEDWFSFETVEVGGDGHLARIDFQHALGDLNLQLLDEQGNSLVHSTGVVSGEEILLGGRPAGKYYLRVYGAADATNPAYALTIDAPQRACEPDDLEPNDGLEAATDLGAVQGEQSWQDLSIHYTGNDDWYRFATVAAGQGGDAVRIDFTDADGNLDLQLHDAEGQTVSTSDGAGDSEEISLAALPVGTYYAHVYGAQGNTNPAYTLTIDGPEPIADASEPNDGLASATDLGPIEGEQVRPDLSIHTSGDEDWFRFETVREAGKVDLVRLDFQHALGDLDLRLLDAGGNLVASSTSRDDGEEIWLDDRAAGTYYVQVVGHDGAVSGDYTLTVHGPYPGGSPDDFEPNDTSASAAALGTIEGAKDWPNLSVHSSTDEDWFEFTTVGPASWPDKVAIQFDHSEGDLDLELYGTDGSKIEGAYGPAGGHSISLDGLLANTYRVRVYGAGGATNCSYQLRIDAPLPDTNIPEDNYEQNDSAPAAKDLGQITGQYVLGNLTMDDTADEAAKEDWFAFSTVSEAMAGHAVRIEFDHTLGDLDLLLMDQTGTQEIGKSVGPLGVESVSLQGQPAGTYCIGVIGHNGATHPNYTLRINAPLPGQGIPEDLYEPNDALHDAWDLQIGPGGPHPFCDLTMDDSANEPQKEDWFSFQTVATGKQGDEVRISFRHDEGDLNLELYDGTGQLLAISTGNTDFERIPLEGRPAGTYRARVYGAGGATNPGYALIVTAPDDPQDLPEWTVLTYLAGDNAEATHSTETDSYMKLTWMEDVAKWPDVQVGVLFDRIPGVISTAPDWTDTRVGVCAYDPYILDQVITMKDGIGLVANNKHVPTDFRSWGERNIGSAKTMEDFLNWAKSTLPAKRYALFTFGHGMGWLGQGFDQTNTDDGLECGELAAALANTGVHLEILGMDGCLMGNLETVYEVSPNVTCVLGSEEIMWLPGMAYEDMLGVFAGKPSAAPEEIAADLVEALAPGWYGALPAYDTLAALDTRRFGPLIAKLKALADTAVASGTEQDILALGAARNRARGFAPGADLTSSITSNFRDLGTFLDALAGGGATAAVKQAAAEAMTAYSDAVIAVKTVPGYKDCAGFSVFLPGGSLCAAVAAHSSFGYVDLAFPDDTDWLDFINLVAQSEGLALPKSDWAEQNDAKASAYAFKAHAGQGLRYPGLSVHSASDVDWFRLTMDETGLHNSQVAIDFSHPEGDLNLFLHNAAGQEIAGSQQSSNKVSGEMVSLAGLAPGPYYVKVVGHSGATNPDYALTMSLPGDWTVDWTETGSDIKAKATTLVPTGGPGVQGLSLTVGDVDWFRIPTTMSLGYDLHVEAAFDAAAGELGLELFSSDGQLLASSTAGGDGQRILLPDVVGGVYYLNVSGQPAADAMAYSLRVAQAGPTVGEFLPPAVAAMELNDGRSRRDVAEAVALAFTEDVAVAADALGLHNETTGLDVAIPGDVPFSYDPFTLKARWDLTGLALPPARYTLTLSAAEIAADGEMLDGNADGTAGDDYEASLLVTYPGDVDLDGEVGYPDYAVVRQHFGWTSGAVWGFGDLNDDGKINHLDYLLLKRNYGSAIVAPPEAPMAGSGAEGADQIRPPSGVDASSATSDGASVPSADIGVWGLVPAARLIARPAAGGDKGDETVSIPQVIAEPVAPVHEALVTRQGRRSADRARLTREDEWPGDEEDEAGRLGEWALDVLAAPVLEGFETSAAAHRAV